MGALLPVAATGMMRDKGASATATIPDVWHVLGYPFEAGSMIAALCACAAVRFYVVQRDHQQHRWTIDAPILALVMMFTAAAVVEYRPEPLMALVYGTTFGVIGAGIIAIVKKNADRILGALGLNNTADGKPEA